MSDNYYRLSSSSLSQQSCFFKTLKNIRIVGKHTACFLVAFPTATLNGIAGLVDNNMRIGAGEVETLRELKELFGRADDYHIAYGVAAFLASEIVLYSLNKYYLVGSVKESFDLFRRGFLTIKHRMQRAERFEEQYNKSTAYEFILFIWSFTTSLIFAELGKKALSFFGSTGEVVGFTLSQTVYFSTRFAGAKSFFKNYFDNNNKLVSHYLHELYLLQDSELEYYSRCLQSNDEQIPPYDPNTIFQKTKIEEFYRNKELFPKSKAKNLIFNYITPGLGYLLSVVTLPAVLLGFMPESVQGLESLFKVHVGEEENYQNILSFSLGLPITLLTVFFYGINIKSLPDNISKTALSTYNEVKNKNYKLGIETFLLTSLAFFISYLTGTGFKYAAETSNSNQYFSYLNDNLSGSLPKLLFVGVITMLWSHLQQEITCRVQNRGTTSVNNTLNKSQKFWDDRGNRDDIINSIESNDNSAINTASIKAP